MTGESLKDWNKLKGKLYVRLDYAMSPRGVSGCPLAVPVEVARGSLRGSISPMRSPST